MTEDDRREAAFQATLADSLIAAMDARSGKLSPADADAMSIRLKVHAGDMYSREDRWRLLQFASKFEELGRKLERIRAKAGGNAPRRGVVRKAEPDIAAMIRQADREQLERSGPFDRVESEILEQERVREQNRQLAETQRRLEEERRRQVAAHLEGSRTPTSVRRGGAEAARRRGVERQRHDVG